MISLEKVLDILNKGEYVSLTEHKVVSELCPYSETKYTLKLKEGGKIQIRQYTVFKVFKGQLFAYDVGLYVPRESKAIKQWSVKNKKDLLFNYIEDIFYQLHREYNSSKEKDYSKYFPQ